MLNTKHDYIYRDHLTMQQISESQLEINRQLLLTINYRTWSRDSHELFDYESTDIHIGSHIINGPCRLIRHGMEVVPVDSNSVDFQENTDLLLNVKVKGNHYYIFPSCLNIPISTYYPQKGMWLVVKALSRGVYTLRESDILKLGRYKLRVRMLVTEEDQKREGDALLSQLFFVLSSLFVKNEVPMITTDDLKYDDKVHCRFCLFGYSDPANPLIEVCECKGSIQFIHFLCLRNWISYKLTIDDKENQQYYFVYKPINCELCHAIFPTYAIINGKRSPILEIPRFKAPYIVLENFGVTNRGLHVCSLAVNNECKLGRGHESNIRIGHVSISRWHATIKYSDGEFLISDHESKFGTLIALRRPIILNSNNHITVQVGRCVIGLDVS